jgi:phosphoribosylformimino-5-aminoimidazole carboxamide ribotide isomerase
MIAIPAIDLKDGKVVRLVQGRLEDFTVYSHDPIGVAMEFQSQGAELIHVIDLDGAFSGRPTNLFVIKEMAKALHIPIQVGGGIRDQGVLEDVFSSGANWAIISTRAIEDAEFLKQAVTNYAEKIVVSIDAKFGKVAKKGWTETTGEDAETLAGRMQAAGIKRMIYTDISRDGTMRGPNIESLKKILAVASQSEVIACGGISSLADVRALLDLKAANLYGVIIGKALYERKLALRALNKFLHPERKDEPVI